MEVGDAEHMEMAMEIIQTLQWIPESSMKKHHDRQVTD
jgi:hypothetical protein